MNGQRRKWLSLDTDILLRLGLREEGAHLFREVALERGHELWTAPQAVKEVDYKITHGAAAEIRQAASLVKSRMGAWQLGSFCLRSAAAERADKLGSQLRGRGWLPELEYRDSMILAQTSIAEIPCLVARDGHFHTDNARLAESLTTLGVPVVVIQTPLQLVQRWLRP